MKIMSGASETAPDSKKAKMDETGEEAMEVEEAGSTGGSSAPMEIDEQLYSRQLYVLGELAMKRLAASKVVICGLGGLGVEIAKNVILGGVGSVTLQDTKNTTWVDLTSQFYLKEDDLGKNRAAQSLQQLNGLNPHVHVGVSTDPITVKYISENKFQVVVLTEGCESCGGKEAMEGLLQYCSDNKIGVILTETRGLFARIFCDFGKGFVVLDSTGENPVSAMIASVTNEKNGLVTCLDEARHGLETGDFVTFKEVQGMEELNNKPPVRIEVIGPYTFKISQDTTNFRPYLRGGIVTQVKMPTNLAFEPFKDACRNPEFLITDFAKMGRSETMNVVFQALDKFISENNGVLPRAWNEEDANKLVEISQGILPAIQDLKTVRLFSYIAGGQVCPMNGFIGGAVAQEVMKACTGKFHPIFQWIFFDALECLSDEMIGNLDDEGKFKNPIDNAAYTPDGGRYDGQVTLFGKQFQENLGNLNYFVVGAGAIGCELLKNFAMLGVATTSGNLYITDMDHIERSNLNRQFLFRPENVGQGKSTTAAAAVQVMNPAIRITHLEERVCSETDHIFNEEFFSRIDGVCNALDNLEARRFVDGKCVLYRKPLVDSGTLGTKGHTQVIIPHLTESYQSSQDPPEKTFPMCTLKNFPNQIEHTLHWAKDLFQGEFKLTVENAAAYLKDQDKFLQKVRNNPEAVEVLENVKKAVIDNWPKHFEDCVRWARLLWEEHFNNSIQQLLSAFPPDHVTSAGTPFWSAPKRCPRPLDWTRDSELAHEFVFCAANLKAEIYGIPQVRDREAVRFLADAVQVPAFVPTPGANTPVAPAIHPGGNNAAAANTTRVSNLIRLIPPARDLKLAGMIKLTPLEFEKDDDSNLHIDFIAAASNCRATNYGIDPATRLESKKIAGNIIPAIATTTSVVSGLVGLELIKLAQGKRNLDQFKNGFINLAIPTVVFSEPVGPLRQKYYQNEWTLWDQFEIQGQRNGREMTLQELIDHFQTQHNLQLVMLSYAASNLLYASFMLPVKVNPRLGMPISQVVILVSRKPIERHVRSLQLLASCEDMDGNSVDVPDIHYLLPPRQIQ